MPVKKNYQSQSIMISNEKGYRPCLVALKDFIEPSLPLSECMNIRLEKTQNKVKIVQQFLFIKVIKDEEHPHPASSTYPYQSRRGAVAYPSCHRVRGRVQHGRIANTESHTTICTQFTLGNLESQINRTQTVGGSGSTRRKPTQTCRENIQAPHREALERYWS